jgi:peptide subunit release factor RF-3
MLMLTLTGTPILAAVGQLQFEVVEYRLRGTMVRVRVRFGTRIKVRERLGLLPTSIYI